VPTPARVVVIGGGVIGLAMAHRLGERGAHVTVVDQRDISQQGASVVNAGWVNPATIEPLPSPASLRQTFASIGRRASPLALAMQPRLDYLRWLATFALSATPRQFARGRRALLTLAANAVEDYATLAETVPFRINARESASVFGTPLGAHRALAALSAVGIPGVNPEMEVLSGTEVRRLEPILSSRAASALVVKQEVQLEPDSLLAALEHAIREAGGTVMRGAPAQPLAGANGRVQAVTVGHQSIPADAVVVAAGAWTPGLVRPLGWRLLSEPGKGYSISLPSAQPPTRVINLADARAGMVPHRDGARLVGMMELSGLNERIDWRAVDRVYAAARPYLAGPAPPRLDRHTTRVGVGMRPMLPGGLPVIDRVGESNVFVSTGHAMMGVVLALASARELTDYVFTGRRPLALEPFRYRGRRSAAGEGTDERRVS